MFLLVEWRGLSVLWYCCFGIGWTLVLLKYCFSNLQKFLLYAVQLCMAIMLTWRICFKVVVHVNWLIIIITVRTTVTNKHINKQTQLRSTIRKASELLIVVIWVSVAVYYCREVQENSVFFILIIMYHADGAVDEEDCWEQFIWCSAACFR